MTLCPHCGSTYVERIGLRLIYNVLIYEEKAYKLRNFEVKVLTVLIQYQRPNRGMFPYTKDSLDVMICQTRKSILTLKLPFKIETILGLGYELVRKS